MSVLKILQTKSLGFPFSWIRETGRFCNVHVESVLSQTGTSSWAR